MERRSRNTIIIKCAKSLPVIFLCAKEYICHMGMCMDLCV